jgi:adenylate cyclase
VGAERVRGESRGDDGNRSETLHFARFAASPDVPAAYARLIRVAAWATAVVLPLAGLMLLLAVPDADVRWEHHPSHFWLVLFVALVSAAVGFAMGEDARRRADLRVALVGLAFLAAGGFLALHALATPGVLLEGKNAGFTIATPVGLLIAAVLSAASSLDLEGPLGQSIARNTRLLRAGLLVLLVAWGAVSLTSLPPLDDPLTQERADGILRPLALVGVGFYAVAAARYFTIWRRTQDGLPLAILTALTLLAQAMVAVAFGRSWHVSWWEWHVLMAVAFALVALTARAERRHGHRGGPFASLYLEGTMARTNAAYADALRELVDGRTNAAEVAQRFGLGPDQAELVERAGARIRQLGETFRPYVSPQVAERLERDPEAAALGGEEREVSVLFADLEGFTSYADGRPPGEVIAMLNEYWGIAVPVVVEEHAGVIERFAGDAVLVIFNADGSQPDHAQRAARAALDLQARCLELTARRPDWPRLRAGVNTGPAVVGHIGAAQQRSFTAIGDTTNVAARLQAAARPGEVVIAAATRDRLGDGAATRRLPPIEAKGKREPLEAYALESFDER